MQELSGEPLRPPVTLERRHQDRKDETRGRPETTVRPEEPTDDQFAVQRPCVRHGARERYKPRTKKNARPHPSLEGHGPVTSRQKGSHRCRNTRLEAQQDQHSISSPQVQGRQTLREVTPSSCRGLYGRKIQNRYDHQERLQVFQHGTASPKRHPHQN